MKTTLQDTERACIGISLTSGLTQFCTRNNLYARKKFLSLSPHSGKDTPQITQNDQIIFQERNVQERELSVLRII